MQSETNSVEVAAISNMIEIESPQEKLIDENEGLLSGKVI